MVKVGRATTVVPHRVHSVRLRELGTDTEFHVIGVYAGCRDARAHVRRTARDDGDEEQRESVRLWRALGACTRGDPRVVVMGDVNAETGQALRRRGRRASWQDAAWQKVIKQSALSVKSVERATYLETSEIDYIAKMISST